jgi:hypothetical protein
MTLRFVAGCTASLLFISAHATPEDRVVLAAMRLSDERNYSWIATVADDARSYEIAGHTERGGYTRVKMPIVNSIRRRLGRGVTDVDVEAIFKGNVRCVIRTDEGWKLLAELPAPEDPPGDAITAGSPPAIRVNKASRRPRKDPEPGSYSNLQSAISHPHEELGIIVASLTDLQVDGDTATGKLNDLGARLLLVHDGQSTLTPVRGSGTFKLWLHDGIVRRYRIALDGVIAVEARGSVVNINVHQTMDTTLTAIGSTNVDVPDEARRKLP